MLNHLIVNNFVIVESLHFDLGRGMCTLTGETGAGKSLILDAIMGVLGQKVSSDTIRQGADSAYLEVGFTPTPALHQLLASHGFEHLLDQPTLTLSKTIHKSGSRSRLNGELITQAFVKEMGVHLMDSIGQHGNQVLFQDEHHLGLLDELGGSRHQRLCDQVADIYQALQSNRSAQRRAAEQQREKERQQDFIAFQLKEIQEAELEAGEEEALIAERDRLRHAEQLQDTVGSVSYGLSSGSKSICDRLELYYRDLNAAAELDADISPFAAQIESALIELQDAAQSLRQYHHHVEHNPMRLQEVEQRLTLLDKLMLKYGVDIPSILAHAENLESQMQSFARLDHDLKKLKEEGESLNAEYQAAAERLTHSRQKLAAQLSPLIERELKDLGMTKTRFDVEFKLINAGSAKGQDQVQFLLSPNPGEPLRPLAKVASGGEASRLLLAFKLVLKRKNPVPTLIFDEIDAGISGKAARVVAEKLAMLARDHQILCITHLPVIASMADHHYWIEKKQGKTSTHIEMTVLAAELRLQRLAQMTSGQVTDSGVDGARELYDQATDYKKTLVDEPVLQVAS